MPASRLERVGAVCGLAFVALLVATFFTPATPDLDEPIAEAITSIRDDRDGLLLNFYLGGLASVAFIGFIGGLWSRSRRAPGGGTLSGALTAAGATFVALILASNGLFFSLTEAVREDAGEDAVQALLVLDNTLFIGAGFALVALFAVLGLMGVLREGLPPWLGWAAAVIALLLVVGLLGVFSEDDEGGPLGVLVFLGFLLAVVWTLVTSIVMLVRPADPSPSAARTSDGGAGTAV
jgi:hypothetical protein